MGLVPAPGSRRERDRRRAPHKVRNALIGLVGLGVVLGGASLAAPIAAHDAPPAQRPGAGTTGEGGGEPAATPTGPLFDTLGPDLLGPGATAWLADRLRLHFGTTRVTEVRLHHAWARVDVVDRGGRREQAWRWSRFDTTGEFDEWGPAGRRTHPVFDLRVVDGAVVARLVGRTARWLGVPRREVDVVIGTRRGDRAVRIRVHAATGDRGGTLTATLHGRVLSRRVG